MAAQSSPPERLIGEIADLQHGVVTRGQLLERGFTRHRIQQRIEAGWLIPLHPGVYRVGSQRTTHRGRWMAAVLAAGSAAVLSHTSAAALWRLMAPLAGPVHVSVWNRSSWRPAGIIIHRPRTLELADRARRHRIPVTSPSRTLIDLAGMVSPTQLRNAFEEAERLELLEGTELSRLCERMKGSRGVGRVRHLLSERPLPASETRSRLEARFLKFCSDRGLPIPAVNVPLGEFTVDFLWPEQRVVVELDAWGSHGKRQAFERDRRRDLRIQLMGHRVVRVTGQRLKGDPDRLEAEFRQLLALSG